MRMEFRRDREEDLAVAGELTCIVFDRHAPGQSAVAEIAGDMTGLERGAHGLTHSSGVFKRQCAPSIAMPTTGRGTDGECADAQPRSGSIACTRRWSGCL